MNGFLWWGLHIWMSFRVVIAVAAAASHSTTFSRKHEIGEQTDENEWN
jgi:hypothetical protein